MRRDKIIFVGMIMGIIVVTIAQGVFCGLVFPRPWSGLLAGFVGSLVISAGIPQAIYWYRKRRVLGE